jgi:enoyl-CoA hydratase/carnithine racemase
VSDALVHRNDDDRIAVITLDSPANRNALSRRLVAELGQALAEAGADESLHGVLLRSSHPVFCAGADLKEAATVDMVESARSIVALQRTIAALPVPVVTRLDGAVRAGGLGLVASSDVVVCRDDATFALNEVRLGLAAAVISIPLRARLSQRAASAWFLTGSPFGAEEALEHGLVTAVVDEASMDGAVAGVLEDLRAGARQGLVEAKRLLNRDLVAAFDRDGDEMARLSGLLFHSDVARERMAAALHG